MAKFKPIDSPKRSRTRSFEDDANKFEETKKKYDEDIEQLHKNYLEQIEKLEGELQEKIEENKREKEISEVTKKIRAERDKAWEDLKQKNEELNQKIYSIEDFELLKAKNEEENKKSLEELQEKLDDSRKELDDSRKELDDSRKELENLKEELTTSREDLEKSLKAHKQSKKAKRKLEKESNKLSNRIIQLKSKIQEYKDNLEACLKSYKTYYTNSVNLRDKLSAKRQKYIDLKEITRSLMDQLEKTRLMREEDISSYSELRQEYQKLSVSYKNLSERSKTDAFNYNQLRLSYFSFKEKVQTKINDLCAEYEAVIEQNQRSFREFMTETSKILLLTTYRNHYRSAQQKEP